MLGATENNRLLDNANPFYGHIESITEDDKLDDFNDGDGIVQPSKSIGTLGSFSLVTNNVCGPAVSGVEVVCTSLIALSKQFRRARCDPMC